MRLSERVPEVPGFEVFDLYAARRELDAEAGPLVRWRMGRFELNRPASECLAQAAGVTVDGLRHQGVLLAFDAGRQVAGIRPAPVSCPSGMRQTVVSWGDATRVRTWLSADWPTAVPARDFVRLYRLAPPRQPVPMRVAGDGKVLAFQLGAVASAAEREGQRRGWRGDA